MERSKAEYIEKKVDGIINTVKTFIAEMVLNIAGVFKPDIRNYIKNRVKKINN